MIVYKKKTNTILYNMQLYTKTKYPKLSKKLQCIMIVCLKKNIL